MEGTNHQMMSQTFVKSFKWLYIGQLLADRLDVFQLLCNFGVQNLVFVTPYTRMRICCFCWLGCAHAYIIGPIIRPNRDKTCTVHRYYVMELYVQCRVLPQYIRGRVLFCSVCVWPIMLWCLRRQRERETERREMERERQGDGEMRCGEKEGGRQREERGRGGEVERVAI